MILVWVLTLVITMNSQDPPRTSLGILLPVKPSRKVLTWWNLLFSENSHLQLQVDEILCVNTANDIRGAGARLWSRDAVRTAWGLLPNFWQREREFIINQCTLNSKISIFLQNVHCVVYWAIFSGPMKTQTARATEPIARLHLRHLSIRHSSFLDTARS